ncbi:polysaccharide lyase family 14 protein [Plicaturopsis crispa FD-325 SS-3]|nr:polysaccharide lyase family 14 protein [Plicaturopsis crispa FD-325 SS-3]
MDLQLFPLPFLPAGAFSTAQNVPNNVSRVQLNDKALGVHRVSKAQPDHRTVDAAERQAWEARYPSGSINPNGAIPGGFGFYLSGPPDFSARLAGKREAVLSYRVMFEPGWEWVKGGKLPGVFGGSGPPSYKCSGGRPTVNERCRCFGLRLMWRANGAGELYAYMPPTQSNTRALLSVPNSIKNPDYGISVGRGAWTFQAGVWTAVAIRVRLNDLGSEDGEIEVFVNGGSVIHVKSLTFRGAKVDGEGFETTGDEDDVKIKGMHFQTFFGGHTEDWASPKDQTAWFSDVSGSIVE